MPSQISHGASGAIRRFAGWVARGSVGYPMLEGINYWDAVAESPSQLEICFAIFANVLELDDQGDPVNDKYAERRAATWLTGTAQESCRRGKATLDHGNANSTDRAAQLSRERFRHGNTPSWPPA
jgi:hypothetical protein